MSPLPDAAEYARQIAEISQQGGGSISLTGAPACGACLLLMAPPVAVCYGIYRGVRRYLPHQQRSFDRIWRQKPLELPPGLNAITAADPAFSVPGFASGSLATLMEVERARRDRQAGPLRMLLSPPLADAESGAFGGAAPHHPESMPVVESLRLVDAQSTPAGDVIAVLFRGRHGSSGHASRLWWSSQWVFERDAAARTSVPSLPATCPGCGAAAQVDPEGRCAFCNALLLSPINWHVVAMRDLSA